jgi:uncharacterized protein with PIN domain
MLGHLARALRILGMDTTYAGSVEDDSKVLETARREGRVLVTRDLELHRRATGAGLEAVLLKDLPVEEQMAIVLTHVGARLDENRFFTRCTVCNGVLEPLAAQDVPDEVPERVRQAQTDFTRCAACGKVYWPGTHVEQMEDRLKRVVELLAGRG